MHEDKRREDLEETRRFAARLVSDSGWAEDLAQDAWLEFLRRPPNRSDRLRSWLREVMRRRANDQHRRRRRGGELESEAARSALVDSTLDLVARAEVRRRLVEEVSRLEPGERDILSMRFFDDLNSPAIGHRLGLDASTVRGRLQRALRRLESRLGSRESWLPAVLPLVPKLDSRSLRRARPGEVLPGGPVSSLGANLASAVGVCTGVAACALAVAVTLSTSEDRPHGPTPAQSVAALGPVVPGEGNLLVLERTPGSARIPVSLHLQQPADEGTTNGRTDQENRSTEPRFRFHFDFSRLGEQPDDLDPPLEEEHEHGFHGE